ncbi:MAG: hypothetical protein ABUT39_25230 [Acidobacteriota bacterium]
MRRLAVLPLLAAVLLAPALSAQSGVTLRKGDILVADAIANAVILIEPDVTDPGTGKALQTLVYQGLNNPRSVAVDPQGNILVTDQGAGAVYAIDPASGKLVRTYNAALLQQPYGLALSAPGQAPQIYTTLDSNGRIAGIDPVSGSAQTVCPSVYFQSPRNLAVIPGAALVADYGAAPGNQPPRNPQPGDVESRSRLVQVDLAACTQQDFLCNLLQRANGVALASGGIVYLSDEAGKQILSLNLASGACKTVSKQPQYQGPREVALQADGTLVMADYAAGAVFVVDPGSGAIVRTFSGGWLKGPNGVFVVGASVVPPVTGSTFQVVDGVYTWNITAPDLQANNTAYTLAAFMNMLVYQSNPQQQQAKDLALTLPPSMEQILSFSATGVTIRGTLDAGNSLVISSITQLGS